MKINVKETIGSIAGICITGICIVALGALSNKYGMPEIDSGSTTYSKAVKTIMDSDMFDSSKKACLDAMKQHESNEVYSAVITIVNSNSFESTKISMIRELFK